MPSPPESTEPAGRRIRPRLALQLIAIIGAALSFNAIRVFATPHAGRLGGIATALLFDAAMWLASRWYIDTARTGQPVRPLLWLSAGLIGVTLTVNVSGAQGVADVIVHGIGPALFAAFTWLEGVIELRAHRREHAGREHIPAGEKLVHPARAFRVWLMMTGTGTTSYTAARAMCQNRAAQRRVWAAKHRPRWAAALRGMRPGWRGKVDPVAYTAYRWGAFEASAPVLTALSMLAPNGAGNTEVAVPGTPASNTPAAVSTASRPVLPAQRERSTTSSAPVRGTALPDGLDSGRDLSASDLAGLIRAGQSPDTPPSVRQVMRSFAVSYSKAHQALALVNGRS